jgi:hypothetical protein
MYRGDVLHDLELAFCFLTGSAWLAAGGTSEPRSPSRPCHPRGGCGERRAPAARPVRVCTIHCALVRSRWRAASLVDRHRAGRLDHDDDIHRGRHRECRRPHRLDCIRAADRQHCAVDTGCRTGNAQLAWQG